MSPTNRSRIVKSVFALASFSAVMFTPSTGSAAEQDTIHVRTPREPARKGDSFTRMFPGLPPFAPPTDRVREMAKKLGEAGGPLDAKDLLTDPIQSILEPKVFSPNNPDNPNMTAGVAFFGQFIDHDLTLDLKSPLLERTDPRRTKNFRTAAFDLDSVLAPLRRPPPAKSTVSRGPPGETTLDPWLDDPFSDYGTEPVVAFSAS
jgi:hypothetical protein